MYLSLFDIGAKTLIFIIQLIVNKLHLKKVLRSYWFGTKTFLHISTHHFFLSFKFQDELN